MKTETGHERAHKAGRAAAQKHSIAIVKNPIEAPIYDAIYSKRLAETLTQEFWDGVHEWYSEQRTNALKEK